MTENSVLLGLLIFALEHLINSNFCCRSPIGVVLAKSFFKSKQPSLIFCDFSAIGKLFAHWFRINRGFCTLDLRCTLYLRQTTDFSAVLYRPKPFRKNLESTKATRRCFRLGRTLKSSWFGLKQPRFNASVDVNINTNPNHVPNPIPSPSRRSSPNVKSNLNPTITLNLFGVSAVFRSDKIFARWPEINQGYCVLFFLSQPRILCTVFVPSELVECYD